MAEKTDYLRIRFVILPEKSKQPAARLQQVSYGFFASAKSRRARLSKRVLDPFAAPVPLSISPAR